MQEIPGFFGMHYLVLRCMVALQPFRAGACMHLLAQLFLEDLGIACKMWLVLSGTAGPRFVCLAKDLIEGLSVHARRLTPVTTKASVLQE
jgi:hypothetical protein